MQENYGKNEYLNGQINQQNREQFDNQSFINANNSQQTADNGTAGEDHNDKLFDKVNNEPEPQRNYTADWLKNNTNISGWLILFLVAVGIGGIRGVISSIVELNSIGASGSGVVVLSDLLLGFSLLGLSVYTIFAFVERKQNAYFYALAYVSLVFLSNLFCLIVDCAVDSTDGIKDNVKGIIWGVIWGLYLLNSTQVDTIIPKSYRKSTKLDRYIYGAIIVLPLVLFFIGCIQINSSGETSVNADLVKVAAAEGDSCDGRVRFKVPKDFVCTSKEESDVKIFALSGSIAHGMLFSNLDTNVSYENFRDCCETCLSEYGDTNMQIIEDKRKDLNGRTTFYRVYKHEIINDYLHFYMIFENGVAVCVVFSDADPSAEYIDELLNSIQFN